MRQDYPSLEQFTDNLVAALGKIEIVRQPLYDYILYPTAGSAQPFNFFTVPAGQGISSSPGNVANVKGDTDTNMQLAGVLPAPQAYWVDGIEFEAHPGSTAAANSYIIQIPTNAPAAAASTAQAGANDINAILSGGALTLNISNKTYYTEGPLLRFPSRETLDLQVAIANNSATAVLALKEKMNSAGEPCTLDPGIGIGSSQAFNVQVNYPVTQATPSGFNARIGVILNGWIFRPVQ